MSLPGCMRLLSEYLWAITHVSKHAGMHMLVYLRCGSAVHQDLTVLSGNSEECCIFAALVKCHNLQAYTASMYVYESAWEFVQFYANSGPCTTASATLAF